MTGTDLQAFLWDQGVMPRDGMLIADDKYSLPDRGWLQNEFMPAYGRLLVGIGAHKWLSEKNDCDDFARLAAAYIGIIHAQTGHRETGLAFGEFWYRRAEGGHAINAAVVNENGARRLVFFEPQSQFEIRLSKKEIESCSAVRF